MDVKNRQSVSTSRAVILLLAAVVAEVTLTSCASTTAGDPLRAPAPAAAAAAPAGR